MAPSLKPLFEPRSIAVIGASRAPGTIGWQVVDNLVRHGFEGAVYPVNPAAGAVHSLPVWRTVREIPADIDLAVIAVPAERVLEVVDECGAKGVPVAVVISAGFREAGEEGAARERALLQRIRRYGMRLIGPNCMGVLNTGETVSMNATFAPTMPPRGPISFLSQSGALGVTILDYASEYGIGIRHFVSVGNKADVSGNDLLEHWESDPETRVILMYLETFGNPRRFTQLARRIGRKKPIVVVKSGRTQAGARAAWSHTGALAAGDPAVDALLAQCGVHRADTVMELFDLAMAFEGLEAPRSNRVAIVTNAGGPGIILADACEAEGMEVTALADGTRDALARVLPGNVTIGNPVHVTPNAGAETYREVLDIVLADPGVDAAIAAFVPQPGGRQEPVARSLADARRADPQTPILAVFMGREGLPEARETLRSAGIPVYRFPESAARALAALSQQGRWLARPVEAPAVFEVDREGASAVLDQAGEREGGWLSARESLRLLEAYGIPTAPWRVVTSPDEAAQAGSELGFPVALRIAPRHIARRAEPPNAAAIDGGAAGERVDLGDPDRLREGYQALTRVGGDDPRGEILATPHRPEAGELVMGMRTDPTFGPVLTLGLGGDLAETFRDLAFRVAPVSDLDAREMLGSLRAHPLAARMLGGDDARCDEVTEALQRLSQLVHGHPEIDRIEIDPFLVGADGAVAAGAAIRVAARPARRRSVRGPDDPREARAHMRADEAPQH